MVFTKTRAVVFLFVAFLLIYPFGQLLRLDIPGGFTRLTIQPIDFVAFGFLMLSIFEKFKSPLIGKHFLNSFVVIGFSIMLSLAYFGLGKGLVGALYFVRLVAYVSIGYLVWNTVSNSEFLKNLVFKGLVLTILGVAVFGWLQYVFVPDLRYLKYFGWDDHLFRLTGTLLDPTFTGIIITVGVILTLGKYFVKGGKIYLIIGFLLLITLAFTYSRAAFISYSSGLIYLALKLKKFGVFLLVPVFLMGLVLLPRPQSEGAQLERTKSIEGRLNNYSETYLIFKKFPLFGVGFNNICAARQEVLDDRNIISHSCSGSDSSILLILATTGVVGFISLCYLCIKIITSVEDNLYGYIFKATLIAVLVHSQFSNSIFYPWVISLVAILFGLALKPKEKT